MCKRGTTICKITSNFDKSRTCNSDREGTLERWAVLLLIFSVLSSSRILGCTATFGDLAANNVQAD